MKRKKDAQSESVSSRQYRQMKIGEPICEGPDWLHHPDLQEFLRAQKLEDVIIQPLGYRRQFAGKAYPFRNLVQIVSEEVHPIRWLMTLIHELAHITDFRGRLRELKLPSCSQMELKRREKRKVWRLDRLHGGRWRSEFIRLTEEAIAAGLFPGNEKQARFIAQKATTAAEDVLFDFKADPRVFSPFTEEWEEERIWQLRMGQSDLASLKASYPPGTIVHFKGNARQRSYLTGVIIRVNRKTFTVKVKEDYWRIPFGHLRKGPAPDDTEPARTAVAK